MSSLQIITINIDVVAGREPYLYDQLRAVPDLMRQAVVRNLLERAIDQPYDIAAITSSSALFGRASNAPPDAHFVVRLTLKPDRIEDRKLRQYFVGISAGRRRPEARSLLAKGLVQAGQAATNLPHRDIVPQPESPLGGAESIAAPGKGLPTRPERGATKPSAPAMGGQRTSAVATAGQALHVASASSPPLGNAPAATDDLDELLDAIPVRN